MQNHLRTLTALLLIACLPALKLTAQEPTATPAVINLQDIASPLEVQIPGSLPTDTWTPEVERIVVYLEAKEFANVRAQPDTSATQLGTIRIGERYIAVGRYVSWVQFQFPNAPTQIGWVFGELVNLTASIDMLPTIDNPFAITGAGIPQLSAPGAGVSGFIATATPNASGALPSIVEVALPTFTYVPNITRPTEAAPSSSNDEEVYSLLTPPVQINFRLSCRSWCSAGWG